MKCPKCQYENDQGDKFCRECGETLPSVCPKCGHALKPGDKFCADCGAKITDASSIIPPKLEDMQKQFQTRIPQSLADRLFAGAKQMQGEYRLVTAMFADVSGSSAMARNMPLEQYINIMDECFKMMVDVISIKYEGSINRFIGDCALAFFGAPITHENDAERAILAGLDIRDAAKELELNVSIGINTGTAYFGEMGSDLLYSERSAWGPDVDFAKRLQESAQPGQIFVGASTYRTTRKAFDFDKPAEIEIKGAKGSAYSVLKVKEHPDKLRGIEGLRASMIGREREFSDLKDSADSLISGAGSIVSIIGEAGLGKSRLANELKEYLKDKDVQWYEGRCISIGQSVSYWPFLDILKSYMNLSNNDSEFEIAKKIKENIMALFPNRYEDILPFLGQLLSVNFGDELDDKIKSFTPEQIKHQTLMRLRGIFATISRQKPLLLILEDIHWADDLSFDLLSLLMDDLVENPIMLLCVYRPERDHKCWHIGDMASRKCPDKYTDITLKKLTDFQCRQLVESLLTIDNLPDSVKNMILRKSEGNPFFIEEVIRYLIDKGLISREDDRWKAKDELKDIDVPDTIQSVLLSRVDGLESETRYILQCASVIGRLFRYRLLDHIAHRERSLNDHLSQLEDHELIFEERTVPEKEYAFKHALTQEATYRGILEKKRMEFHNHIAEGMETLYKERIEECYDELAYHYNKGGNLEKAIEYLIKAGDKSRLAFANHQAVTYYNEALEKMEILADEKLSGLWEGKALEGLGEVYYNLGEFRKVINSLQRAIPLAIKRGESPYRLADLHFWISDAMHLIGDWVEARDWAESGLDLLGDDHTCPQAALLFHVLRSQYHPLGENEKSDEYLAKNRNLLKSGKLQYFDKIFIVYLGTAWAEYTKGNLDEAIRLAHDCIRVCEANHNDLGLAEAYSMLGRFTATSHTYEDMRKSSEYSEKSFDLHKQFEYGKQIIVCLSRLMFSYCFLGEEDKAEEILLESVKWMRNNQRDNLHFVSSLIYISQMYLKQKHNLEKAIKHCKSALEQGPSSHQLVYILSLMEEAYTGLGKRDEFISYCDEIKPRFQDSKLTRFYLEQWQPSESFTKIAFEDDFNESTLKPEWQCQSLENSDYTIHNEKSYLEIRANSRKTDFRTPNSSPRLLQKASGKFAVEIKIGSIADDVPWAGGIVICRDEQNSVFFWAGIINEGDIVLQSSNSKDVFSGGIFFGRGRLISDPIYLRLERFSDKLLAYCSADGEKWFICAETVFQFDDPIQVGIFASGRDLLLNPTIDKINTATRFDWFRIFTK